MNTRAMVVVISFGLAGAWARAQNLVPNPSFEEYTTCPTDQAQLERALGWESIGISPDYFNSCCTTDTVDVPTNMMGHQWASDGQAYIGVGTFPLDAKEYAQAQLTAPLVPGQPVHVSMRVSPGGFGILAFTSPILASSGIGMHFTVQPLETMTYYGQFEYNQAVVVMDGILQDTSAWITLGDVYIPDSAYQYVQLGNFFTDSLTTSIELDPDGDFPAAYAFIDEVCVSVAPNICNLPASVTTGSVLARPITSTIFGDRLNLDLDGLKAGIYEFALFDAVGRLCWRHTLSGQTGQYIVPAEQWASGPYYLMTQHTLGVPCTISLFKVSP